MAAIEAASRAFSAAYVGNDMNALGQLYTEDAVLLPHGREVRGRAEVQRFFARKPSYRQVAHSMKSANLDLRGDTAIDTGTWHSTIQRGDEPPDTSSGAYLVVWVRDDAGTWRIKYDMWHRPTQPSTP
jgi:ketosteroid isomerase-like protein